MQTINTMESNCFNTKCGEIYYLSCSNFYVLCFRCELKIVFEQFPEHYERQHLNLGSIKNKQINKESLCGTDDEALEDAPEDEQVMSSDGEAQNDTNEIENQQDDDGTNGLLLTDALNANDDTIGKSAVSDENDSKTSSSDSFEQPLEAAETFTCTKCARTYPTKDKFKRHVYTCQKPKKPKKKIKNSQIYKCTECNQTFAAGKLLENHKYTHTGIFCDICGKTFSQLGNMRTHRLVHNATKAFKCEHCDKAFTNKKLLKVHMKRHTDNWQIVCELCGKRYFEAWQLREHMRRHTGERPAKCNVCGKSFYCNYDLNVHSVTHSDERPFKCDICGVAFRLKKSWRVHQKKHSNKALNHVCQMCDKAFAEAKGLTAHLRTHDAAKNNITLLAN